MLLVSQSIISVYFLSKSTTLVTDDCISSTYKVESDAGAEPFETSNWANRRLSPGGSVQQPSTNCIPPRLKVSFATSESSSMRVQYVSYIGQ